MTAIIELQKKLEDDFDLDGSTWAITQTPLNHGNNGPLILENDTGKITIVDGPLTRDGVLTIEKLEGSDSQSLKVDNVQEGFDIITTVYM